MGDGDWDKPQVAIASSWNEVTPCNVTLRKLAEDAKAGVRAAGGFPMEFGTITVSDGISMGHEGMRASLVSREIICDSVRRWCTRSASTASSASPAATSPFRPC
jgi:dihydroxy-acid dehydratase